MFNNIEKHKISNLKQNGMELVYQKEIIIPSIENKECIGVLCDDINTQDTAEFHHVQMQLVRTYTISD